ncbi:hypothetical protein EON64_16480 [archaeon]|nr:MAG: hypothetical protein EON64_16480 [archaeon]
MELLELFTQGHFVVSGTTVDSKIQELAKNRWIANNRHQKTLRAIKTELGIQDGFAEVTTNATAKAVVDFRNAVTFMVISSIMVAPVNSALLINADSAQFAVGSVGDGKVKISFLERPTQLKADPNDTIHVGRHHKAQYQMLNS